MDELTEISSKLRIPTTEISSEIVQIVMVQAKRSLNSKERRNDWNDLTELLWNHLQTGLSKYDDQLLCATCFFSVLPLTDNTDLYLDRVHLLINNELDLKGKNDQENTKDDSKISEVVSVMYGLFQSAFLTQKSTGDTKCVENILKSSFNLLLVLAYEYSRFTYLAFKTINALKKVLGTNLQKHIFDTNGQILLLNLVNHNWESPITGVRDLNRGIFHMVIVIMDQDMYDVIFKEIGNFYWNKAKYLMLSEIIEQSNFDIQEIVKQNDWIDGLTYSLHKPGLVSAGADMYYTVLKKLNSDSEWCDLFLKEVTKIFTAESSKAIENFTNYWCLTTFKKFPSLAKTLIDELDLEESTEMKIYSSLSLLKQANKLGLLQKDWTTEEVFPQSLVLRAVESCNPFIRILAFDVICVSQSKTMPHNQEYDAVLNYLQDNVNSDCTVLRLSMLNSLNRFLMRLHTNIMTSKGFSHIENLTSFCMALQNIIVDCINLNGNYQRKITTVKLCKLVQDYFNNPPKKMQNKGSRGKAVNLAQMLKEKKCWILNDKSFVTKLLSLLNDPSDDIRENVTLLLLTHYSKEFQYPLLLNQLIHDALKNMRSKFFYDINCGRSMFKLITNILLAEESSAEFKNVEDVFLFAYNELKTEYKLKRDIVKSIENGKQLHSLITILQVVLEVCYQNSYKIGYLEENFFELVTILEGISNQFAWEDTSTSSDFSKMSDMVQNMIATSVYDTCDEIDQTKISGLHQIVLNCLWLNVKVSCDLASFFVQFTEDIEVIDRCLKIITRVLETCRHKGAIEAAGAAIGRAIQYLTSLPEGSPIQQLPYALLRSKLKDLISEAGSMASITRRGAGLSIMVHRIVSGDMKKGKPLFHYFMETLLGTCNKMDDIPESNDESTIDNQKDLPKAIYIHFLTRIVTDSSLASDMMYYSAKLAALAFGNLTSPRWQIRNAALQLYGALVPKLIGQKKASGSDDETVATVACDEFRTHSPALWEHITHSMAVASNASDVEAHSNLVPILNILGNIARRYNFSFDIEAQSTNDGNPLINLISLLDSPLYTIRRLTAKCICNIYSFEFIYAAVVKKYIKSENYLHGILMLLMIYHKKKNVNNFSKLKAKFEDILNNGNHSYICRQLYEELFFDNILEVNDVYKTLIDSKNNEHSPGIFLWAERRIEKYVIKLQWKTVPQILETLLDHHCELYGTFLLRKLKSSDNVTKEVLLEISEQLLTFNRKYDSTVIWEILYDISLKVNLVNVDVKVIFTHIKGNDVPYKLRYAIPLAARVSKDVEDLSLLSEIILQLSDPEKTDSDMRHIAALANNEIALAFDKLPDAIRINAITSAVILLQDEDEDIRIANVQFYKNLKGGHSMNSYICLRKILSHEFVNSVLQSPVESIEILCDILSKMFLIKSSDVGEYNPFANDSKNIYSEGQLIRQFIEKLR